MSERDRKLAIHILKPLVERKISLITRIAQRDYVSS